MQALWMILASLAFSVMSVCIKYASVYYSSMEILMYRGLVGIAIFAVLMWLRRIPLGTPVIGMHIKRNLAGVIAMSLWFYSIVHMPFATAVVLNSMAAFGWLPSCCCFRGGKRARCCTPSYLQRCCWGLWVWCCCLTRAATTPTPLLCGPLWRGLPQACWLPLPICRCSRSGRRASPIPARFFIFRLAQR